MLKRAKTKRPRGRVKAATPATFVRDVFQARCEGTMLDWKKVPGGLSAWPRVPCNRLQTEQRMGLDGTIIGYCDICAQMHDLRLKIEEEAGAS